MNKVGRSEVRVDAFDKATGRTKYYEDRMPSDALYVRIKHAEIAHAMVKSIDTSVAEEIPGVVKVLTCFDVPEIDFPTAGHPWSMDPGHQDVADRRLLNRHVRYWGDDVAVVIAENEVAANQGVRALKVEYDPLPFVLDVQKAMEDGAPRLHERFPNNILKHTDMKKGDYQTAIRKPGLIKVEGWYDTPTVQHCHIENFGCFAYEENGRIVVVSSTQIPHIIRRAVGQALGRPWADIEIIKARINKCIELSEGRDLIRHTERDKLTGLLNKDYFFRYVDRLDHIYRDTSLDAVACGINDLRSVNRQQGRLFGDYALRSIGTGIRKLARKTGGIGGMLEGGIFLLYCPHQDDYEELLKEFTAEVFAGQEEADTVSLRFGIFADAQTEPDIEERFVRAQIAADREKDDPQKTFGFY